MKSRIIGITLFLIISISVPLQAKEFLNTLLHLNFCFLYTFGTIGDAVEREKKYYIPTNPDDTNDPKNKNVHPDHYETGFGLSMDLVPFRPIILGNEAHAVKFGLRAGYSFHYLHQNVTVDQGTGDKKYGGNLFTYNCMMVGPVIHYAPSIEPVGIGEYSAGGGFTFFALAGRLSNGQYKALPASRDYGDAVSDYQRTVKGWKFDIGCGAALAVCSINVGLNLYYSYIDVNLNKALPQTAYAGMGKESNIKEFCFEIYWGIPIEWFVDPELF